MSLQESLAHRLAEDTAPALFKDPTGHLRCAAADLGVGLWLSNHTRPRVGIAHPRRWSRATAVELATAFGSAACRAGPATEDTCTVDLVERSVVVVSLAAAIHSGATVMERDRSVRAALTVTAVLRPLLGGSGWMAAGYIVPVASAAGVAVLRGQRSEEICAAMGIASSMTVSLRDEQDPVIRDAALGRASGNGVLAAILASYGFTAATDGLEGDRGWLQVAAGPARRAEVVAAGDDCFDRGWMSQRCKHAFSGERGVVAATARGLVDGGWDPHARSIMSFLERVSREHA